MKKKEIMVPEVCRRISAAKDFETLLKEIVCFRTGEETPPEEVFFINEKDYHPQMRVVKGNNGFATEQARSNITNTVRVSYWHNNAAYLLYVEEDGRIWSCKAKFWNRFTYGNPLDFRIKKESWELVKNRIFLAAPEESYLLVNSRQQTEEILQRTNLYGYTWFLERRKYFAPEKLLMAPCLEMLDKAGYSFAWYLWNDKYDQTECQMLSRLCRLDGKNMREIFKTPKSVYTALKTNTNLRLWDSVRKLEKKLHLQKETVRDLLDGNFNDNEIRLIYEILGATYNGRQVFTFPSLMNYLRRIDMNEAIDRDEGLPILKDYLQMCRMLDVQPRTDSDSLKREHDVVARLCRQRRNDITNRQMRLVCDKIKCLNYEEGVFIIRSIRDFDDLLDEAKQQGNCVAGYARQIIAEKSYIFVLREKKNPDKSLVTIELSPDLKTVRQKLMAYNQPIRNKAINDCIKRWQKNIPSLMKTCKTKTENLVTKNMVMAL